VLGVVPFRSTVQKGMTIGDSAMPYDRPEPVEPDFIAPDAQVPALRVEGGAAAIYEPPTVEERMLQIQEAPGLAEAVDGDEDEDLFRMAFGDDDAMAAMEDLMDEEDEGLDLEQRPQQRPVYQPPAAAIAAVQQAGLLAAPEHDGLPAAFQVGGGAVGMASPLRPAWIQ
jgi:hypothetical protein